MTEMRFICYLNLVHLVKLKQILKYKWITNKCNDMFWAYPSYDTFEFNLHGNVIIWKDADKKIFRMSTAKKM
jgi:hypothetical protein